MSFSGGNPRVTKKCEQCGISFRTRNQDKKYCSDKCRKSSQNNRHRSQANVDTGVLISDDNREVQS